jgi:predicted ribosome quality control (RQC) complex YloA/Tae2 family protein
MDVINKTPSSFEQEKNRLSFHLLRLIKRTQNQVTKREKILWDCQHWEVAHHKALLLQSNLYRIKKGMAEIAVADWEREGVECILPLDPRIDPKDQLTALFRQAKKLRLGIPHSKRQLQLIIDLLATQQQFIAEVQKINSFDALEAFLLNHPTLMPSKGHQKITKQTEPAKPYHTYTSQSGVTIWVGKNAKHNDKLTFHYANGSDWWLHAHNYPGSHVVIRCLEKGKDPDQETVQDAAELALRFSKAKDKHDEGDVTVSQVKFIKRFKGSPGKVHLSKHRVMHVRLDLARWDRLRGR